jgi:hypothetical protein
MSPRLFFGLALWLGLGALPVLHLGVARASILVLLVPLFLLPWRSTALVFPAALLPLLVLRPDLLSPRVYGLPGIAGSAALLVAYLVVALRDPLPRTPRPRTARPRDGVGRALVGSAALLGACGVAAPYTPGLAQALRQGHGAAPGAAASLLALGCVLLAVGSILVYLAAPLDAAAGRRS